MLTDLGYDSDGRKDREGEWGYVKCPHCDTSWAFIHINKIS